VQLACSFRLLAPFARLVPSGILRSFGSFRVFSEFRSFRNFGVSEFRSFGVSEFRIFRVSEFRSFGVLDFRSFGVSEFQSFGVSEFQSFRVSEFQSPLKRSTRSTRSAITACIYYYDLAQGQESIRDRAGKSRRSARSESNRAALAVFIREFPMGICRFGANGPSSEEFANS